MSADQSPTGRPSEEGATYAALERLKAKVLDRRQMVTEGPLIGRIKVAGWIDSEQRSLTSTDPAVRAALLEAVGEDAALAWLVERGRLTEERAEFWGLLSSDGRRLVTPWEAKP